MVCVCAKCGNSIGDNRHTVEFQNSAAYGYTIKRGYHVCDNCFYDMEKLVDGWGTLGYQEYVPNGREM